MTNLVSNYEKILARNKELSILQSTESIMHWDMETKMPPNGVNLRSLQLAQLSQIEHRLATARQIGILLERIEKHHDYTSLSELQRRNIHLIRKNFDEQTKIPEKLVTETERQRTLTVNVWKRAKGTRDFSLFRPELGKLFDLKKQAAEILMSVKKTSTPYDALIDIFEPKMTSDTIATVFEKLRKKLVTIIEKCSTSQKKPNTSFLRRKVPIDIQRKISDSLAEFIGYDVTSNKAGGRIDETEHPFTTGYFDDVRITTHYYEDNLESSIFSTLHEGGHAKYEQGFRLEWIYQPIGASPSYGFHESQSRFVENIVGRSTEFWKFYFPKLETLTGHVFSDINIHDFIRAVNLVEPSKIRIEADEVTYSLHIIIRFEIERALFDGKVKIDELPEIWNEKYNSYLGLKIQNDSEGVMQDTHWADGSFGYFPSYALGNIYSGQLLSRMTKDLSGWLEDIEKGSYQKVDDWLTKNIYSYGNLLDPADLLKRITGQEINVDYYIRYLDSKYSELYGY
ncbi:carboxypeptidase M32 [Candidatus Bathyarchaeota archaeon]|nr:carboxypeptidase M32 [Candidatus Bathyarchaeota archaeon]